MFLRHNGIQARLGLTQDRDGGQDVFDETRIGLAHVAFGGRPRGTGCVGDAANSRRSRPLPVATASSIPGAAVLVLREPDNIQLELFVDPSDRPAMTRSRSWSLDARLTACLIGTG